MRSTREGVRVGERRWEEMGDGRREVGGDRREGGGREAERGRDGGGRWVREGRMDEGGRC